jgi:hypothetical protein
MSTGLDGNAVDFGGLSIFPANGAWGWSLRLPAINRKLRGDAETLAGVFDSVEASLQAPKVLFKVLDEQVESKWKKSCKIS